MQLPAHTRGDPDTAIHLISPQLRQLMGLYGLYEKAEHLGGKKPRKSRKTEAVKTKLPLAVIMNIKPGMNP